jgi:nitrate/nitrite transport system substrate-binding protein
MMGMETMNLIRQQTSNAAPESKGRLQAMLSARTRLDGSGAVDLHHRNSGNGRTSLSFHTGPRLTSRGGPETKELTFGFVPLTDAAPLIVAHEKGLFEEQGIVSRMRREPSWTALRDSLNKGTAHAAQMLFGMPVAAACGLLGDDQKPLVVPWVLNCNGQAITLKNSYKGKVQGGAETLRDAAIAGRHAGRPLVFGHTLRIGTHSMWLRYWLAAGGIDSVRDVALITVPPPLMVRNLGSSAMDGFCVGEPWNARAAIEGVGFTAVTSQEIWPNHPEKVCAFTEEFAAENPRSVIAVLKALHHTSEWLDDPSNHAEAARLLAANEYLNCDPVWIQARLGGSIDYGDGRTETLPHSLSFSGCEANYPRRSHTLWFLTQLRRWGLHYGTPDYEGVANQVVRQDYFQQALEELGVPIEMTSDKPEVLCDGKTFNPTEPEDYALNFSIHNIQG